MEQDIKKENFENMTFEGLSEKEAREFNKILINFTESYLCKNSGTSDEAWLKEKFKEELPNLTDKEAEKLSNEICSSILEFDTNLKDINTACNNGYSKEAWFASKMKEASISMSVAEYGDYLQSINLAINNANKQMARTIIASSGNINQCLNLDGFIAEQAHVNSFNMNAALQKSKYRAEVCVPEVGKTYGLNSFDVVIKDTKENKIIHQYQLKYGADAKSTIKLFKHGNYNNQRMTVPLEQVDEVQRVFPGKTVQAYIGGTEQVPIKSVPLSKEDVKKLQLDAQNKNAIPTTNWNAFNTKELAINLGKNAALCGVQSAAITTGFSLAQKAAAGERIEGEQLLETALVTGCDAGVKAATAGAIKVAMERGIITIIPKGTPAKIIADIATIGIEEVKILYRLCKGEITVSEALEMMGRTYTTMIYGISGGIIGAQIGAAALSFIPIVGSVIGGLAGGMIGHMAGSKYGNAIYDGCKKIKDTVVNTTKKAANKIKDFGKKVRDKFRLFS